MNRIEEAIELLRVAENLRLEMGRKLEEAHKILAETNAKRDKPPRKPVESSWDLVMPCCAHDGSALPANMVIPDQKNPSVIGNTNSKANRTAITNASSMYRAA